MPSKKSKKSKKPVSPPLQTPKPPTQKQPVKKKANPPKTVQVFRSPRNPTLQSKPPLLMGVQCSTIQEAVGATRSSSILSGVPGKSRIAQPQTADHLLSNLDTMLLAKLEPGSINAPYVTDMNTVPVPSMTYSVNRSFNQIADLTISGYPWVYSPPGTRTYTVFLSCPVLSQTLQTSPTDPQSRKSAGFHLAQIDDPSDPAFNINALTIFSYVLEYMLGSDPADFSQNALVWAQQNDYALTIPSANLAGNVWKGSLQFRQLFDKNYQALKWSVNDFIAIADSVHRLTENDTVSFNFKSAVVNHSILSQPLKSWRDGQSANYMDPYQNEIVNFVVVENAARNITSGELTKFTISQNLRGNLAFFPKGQNALMNNLFRGQMFQGNTYDRENHLAKHIHGFAHEPQARATPELVHAIRELITHSNSDGSVRTEHINGIGESIWKGVKSIPSLVLKYGPKLLSLAGMLATLPEESEVQAFPPAPLMKWYLLKKILTQIDDIGDSLLPSEQKIAAQGALQNVYAELKLYPEDEIPLDYFQQTLSAGYLSVSTAGLPFTDALYNQLEKHHRRRRFGDELPIQEEKQKDDDLTSAFSSIKPTKLDRPWTKLV